MNIEFLKTEILSFIKDKNYTDYLSAKLSIFNYLKTLKEFKDISLQDVGKIMSILAVENLLKNNDSFVQNLVNLYISEITLQYKDFSIEATDYKNLITNFKSDIQNSLNEFLDTQYKSILSNNNLIVYDKNSDIILGYEDIINLNSNIISSEQEAKLQEIQLIVDKPIKNVPVVPALDVISDNNTSFGKKVLQDIESLFSLLGYGSGISNLLRSENNQTDMNNVKEFYYNNSPNVINMLFGDIFTDKSTSKFGQFLNGIFNSAIGSSITNLFINATPIGDIAYLNIWLYNIFYERGKPKNKLATANLKFSRTNYVKFVREILLSGVGNSGNIFPYDSSFPYAKDSLNIHIDDGLFPSDTLIQSLSIVGELLSTDGKYSKTGFENSALSKIRLAKDSNNNWTLLNFEDGSTLTEDFLTNMDMTNTSDKIERIKETVLSETDFLQELETLSSVFMPLIEYNYTFDIETTPAFENLIVSKFNNLGFNLYNRYNEINNSVSMNPFFNHRLSDDFKKYMNVQIRKIDSPTWGVDIDDKKGFGTILAQNVKGISDNKETKISFIQTQSMYLYNFFYTWYSLIFNMTGTNKYTLLYPDSYKMSVVMRIKLKDAQYMDSAYEDSSVRDLLNSIQYEIRYPYCFPKNISKSEVNHEEGLKEFQVSLSHLNPIYKMIKVSKE